MSAPVIDIVRPPVEAPPLPGRHRRRSLLDVVAARRTALLRALPTTVVLAGIGLLYQVNLGGWPVVDNDDEGTYLAQAWAVAHEGVMAHYTYWYDHPPLGWVQLSALLTPAMWLTGAGSGSTSVITAGRTIMGLFVVATAYLLYRLARNLGLPRLAALAAPLVWSLSPLTQYMGRQVFLDNVALTWLVAAFVLVSGRSDLRRHVLAGVCFGIAVLCKETSLLAAPGLVLMLWISAWNRTRAFAVVGAAVATGVIGFFYLLFAGIKGEILPGPGHTSIGEALLWQVGGRTGSGWLLDEGSVSHQVVSWWVFNDGWLLGAGAVATVLGLLHRRARPLSVVVLCFAAMGIRPSGYLPFMYVENLLPFMAVLVVTLTWSAWQRFGHAAPRPRLLARGVVALAVAALVVGIAPSWASKTAYAVTADENDAYLASLRYVEAELPRDSVILTDDNAWNDLVAAGWSPDGWSGPVWHFKLDRDPAARAALPEGWRDVDYVLVGRAFANSLGTAGVIWAESPEVMSALTHSTVVRTWGPPGGEVELRRVDPAMVPESEACLQWTCPADGPTDIGR